MHNYYITEMVQALHGLNLAKPAQRIEALKRLQAYWEDKVAFTWTAADIAQIAKTHGRPFSRLQLRSVMDRLLDDHDAAIGVNWTVIAAACEEELRLDTRDPQSPVMKFNHQQACLEGWLLAEEGEIQRLDYRPYDLQGHDPKEQVPVFADDAEALAFVRKCARAGSLYHKQALGIHEAACRKKAQ